MRRIASASPIAAAARGVNAAPAERSAVAVCSNAVGLLSAEFPMKQKCRPCDDHPAVKAA
jgi:hypothetical protein